MIWEIGQDVAANNQYSLLKAIKDETDRLGGATGPVNPQNRTITVTHNGNGTVKNGGTTINSGSSAEVQNGGSVTLTITANNGYQITDVKINGMRNSQAISNGSYTFSNVTNSQTIEVTFAKRINIPGTFNATEYSTKTNEIVPTTDANGTYVGYLETGSTLEYLINVTQEAGTYKVSAEMATESAGRSISLYDGNSSSALGILNVPNTGGWFNWTAVETNITLSAGNRTLRIVASAAINIKNITISKVGAQVQQYTINASAGSGGTISPNGTVTVNDGGSQTFTITPNNGKVVDDVKVNGTSVGAKLSHTFSNVKANATISVTFKDGGGNPQPSGAPDLADGTWGDDAWSKVFDEGQNGSTMNITSQGNPLTATWKLGPDPWDIYEGNVPEDKWPYVGMGFYGGDWTNVTKITIKYSTNQPFYIALSMPNEIEYIVGPLTGNNQEKPYNIGEFQFDPFDWSGGTHSGLDMSKVEGITINAYESNEQTTNLTVTSLVVQGLVFEEEEPATPIIQRKVVSKAIMKAGASIVNGKLNLSLPVSANNANIVLFDVRGRILFESDIAINSNFASVTLPQNILRNQAAILRIKTNSGFNLTKRILIK
jgi:hypothetical protein